MLMPHDDYATYIQPEDRAQRRFRPVPVSGVLHLDLRGADADQVRRAAHEAVSSPPGAVVVLMVDGATDLDYCSIGYLTDEGRHLAGIQVHGTDATATGRWVHYLQNGGATA